MHVGDVAGARATIAAIESDAGADSGTWRRLAEFHTHLNQHEQAATCAIRVATLKPYDAQAAYTKASALIAVGRMEEAEAILDELIARTPDDADAWYNRATLRRQPPGRNHVAALRAALAARSPGAAPVALHYALAKELEDLGRVRGILRGARAGRRGAPQGALLPRRGRRAGDRLDHPLLRPRVVRRRGSPGFEVEGPDFRRRPAEKRHDAGRADPDPPRAGCDGRRGQRPRAGRHARSRTRRRARKS